MPKVPGVPLPTEITVSLIDLSASYHPRRRDLQVPTQAETVLIIDADLPRREVLQKLLREAGLEVRLAPGFDGIAQQVIDSHPGVTLLATDSIDNGFAQLI